MFECLVLMGSGLNDESVRMVAPWLLGSFQGSSRALSRLLA